MQRRRSFARGTTGSLDLRDISTGGGKKEEDDRSLGSAWKRSRKLLRGEPSSHPLSSNATKFPYLGLTYTLARPFPPFFHPLSLSLCLSKPQRTSFLHKSRAFNARFERGGGGGEEDYSVSESVMERGESWRCVYRAIF